MEVPLEERIDVSDDIKKDNEQGHGQAEPGGHARAPADGGSDRRADHDAEEQAEREGGLAPGDRPDAERREGQVILEIQGDLLGKPTAVEPEEHQKPAESGEREERAESEPSESERALADALEKVKSLEDALAAARSETEQRLDDLRRLKAEFENFRKRTQRDQVAAKASASSALMVRLLPVLDNFELAISSAEHSQDFEKMLKGVEMVYGELREVLRSEGVREITADGEPFDPQRHEAVVAVEANDVQPGTVVSVVRTGYELQGKVLRPAMVKVAQ
jgi:molecular chaperone GrpE